MFKDCAMTIHKESFALHTVQVKENPYIFFFVSWRNSLRKILKFQGETANFSKKISWRNSRVSQRKQEAL